MKNHKTCRKSFLFHILQHKSICKIDCFYWIILIIDCTINVLVFILCYFKAAVSCNLIVFYIWLISFITVYRSICVSVINTLVIPVINVYGINCFLADIALNLYIEIRLSCYDRISVVLQSSFSKHA
jgi:hypothetical protein